MLQYSTNHQGFSCHIDLAPHSAQVGLFWQTIQREKPKPVHVEVLYGRSSKENGQFFGHAGPTKDNIVKPPGLLSRSDL